jgi:hypothetical protein
MNDENDSEDDDKEDEEEDFDYEEMSDSEEEDISEEEDPIEDIEWNEETPGRDKLIKLTEYIPFFEDPSFALGEITPGRKFSEQEQVVVGEFPQPNFNKKVEEFLQDCLDSGILVMKPTPQLGPRLPGNWDDLVIYFRENPDEFDSADLDHLRVYLSAIFQISSILPTLMHEEFKQGRILKILRRLRELCEG